MFESDTHPPVILVHYTWFQSEIHWTLTVMTRTHHCTAHLYVKIKRHRVRHTGNMGAERVSGWAHPSVDREWDSRISTFVSGRVLNSVVVTWSHPCLDPLESLGPEVRSDSWRRGCWRVQNPTRRTKSQCCSWKPVAKSIKYCTMSWGIAWSNHHGAEPCTSADEKNACQRKKLGKATSDLRQGRRLHVWAKKVENYVSGVFPNLRGALSFVVESQDVVNAAADALGVPELDAETSEGGDRGFESRRKLHKRWDPHTAGRARRLLRERFCHHRERSCLSWRVPSEGWKISWDAWCPRKPAHPCGRHSLEFTGSSVAGWSRKTRAVESCETDVVCCLETKNQNTLWVYRSSTCSKHGSRKACHTQEEVTQRTSVHSARTRASTARVSMVRAIAKGSKDSKDRKTRTRTGTRTRNQLNVGIVESAITTRRIVGARRTRPTKMVQKEQTKTRTQRTLTILTRWNQQTVNQKLKSEDSTWVFSIWMLWTYESLDGSRSELTQVQDSWWCGSHLPHSHWRTCELGQAFVRWRLRRLVSQSQSLRCPSAWVQTTAVCLTVTQRWVKLQLCMVTKGTCSTRARMLPR